MKTKAAILYELGGPLRIEEVTVPCLGSGQVLVDVAFSGVCHTQLLEVRGKRGADRFLPHTLGHEGSGTVLEVGRGVTKVKPGEHVVISWIKGIGDDVPSTVYKINDTTVNSGAVSTFMDCMVTCENRVTPIIDAMPLREAALLGCAIPTGAGIVLNTAGLRDGSSVAVFGIGGVGLSAVLAASMTNCTTIIAIDVFDNKLEQARRGGATHVINARDRDPVAAIFGITANRGVDCTIESAGKREAMEAAFQVVREGGGVCVLAGNLPHGERISINPFDLIKGKRIVGTTGGESQLDKDVPRYVDLYLQGKLDLDALISHTCGLDQINRMLDDLEQGKVMRALIDMSILPDLPIRKSPTFSQSPP